MLFNKFLLHHKNMLTRIVNCLKSYATNSCEALYQIHILVCWQINIEPKWQKFNENSKSRGNNKIFTNTYYIKIIFATWQSFFRLKAPLCYKAICCAIGSYIHVKCSANKMYHVSFVCATICSLIMAFIYLWRYFARSLR